jgi:predicted RNA-binding protein with PUA-like domain
MPGVVRKPEAEVAMARKYWLFKSDPETFGWDDLERAPGKRTVWDGIRNPQARNHLRDEVRTGDGVLFYHSQSDKAVVGSCNVTRAGFPEPGHDPWVAVEIEAEAKLRAPVTLEAIRAERGLAEMVLVKNSRLSVQPVSASEWTIVTRMGEGSKRKAGR